MTVNLHGRSLLKLLDYSSEEIRYLLELSAGFKEQKRAGRTHRVLSGNIVLLFEKTSTRTRCAFEVAAADLGLGVVFLDPASSQMGNKESIADTARVLGRMFEGIEYRGFAQRRVEEIARYAGVPVYNGLTDEFHPTQVLADMLSIQEVFGRLQGVHLTYFGDARNNTAHSLMVGCAKLGLHFTACSPQCLSPDPSLVEQCRLIAQQTGGSITLTSDRAEGARGADVIYTDIWVSMGESYDVWEDRIQLLLPYRVDSELMGMAKSNAVFMHCLPSFHDLETSVAQDIHNKFGLEEMEVTDQVFLSKQSIVFDEAENRMHTIKAVLYATLGPVENFEANPPKGI